MKKASIIMFKALFLFSSIGVSWGIGMGDIGLGWLISDI